ncbi:MAG: AI-2E family transporter [Clostridia bacterium]|nr:AI-2E family transporter [Clostridia bacterium]
MKNELNKRYLTIAAYALGVILFSLAFFLLSSNILQVLDIVKGFFHEIRSIIYGVLFALFFFPFMRTNEAILSKWLCRKKERKTLVKILSIVSIYLIFFIVVALVFTMVIPPMLTTITELRATLITSINSTKIWIESIAVDFPFVLTLYDSVAEFLTEELFSSSESSLVSQIQSLGSKVLSEISSLVIGLIISIYFLASRRYLSSVIGKALAAIFTPQRERKIAHFIKRLYTDFTEFISARILCSLYMSSITFLVCRLFGIPFYPLIFLILLVLNIAPVFGPMISTLLTVSTIFITSRHHTVILILTILVTQIFENFIIEPAMLKRKLRPNVGATIVISLAFYSVFGILGVIVSIPLFATLSVEFRQLIAKILAKKNLPINAKEYENYDPMLAIDGEKSEPANVTEEAPTENKGKRKKKTEEAN